MSDSACQQVERLFHRQIPVTVAIGVQVVECDETGLVLTAPLAANHNHLGTAFGGSLSAVATLAGYGLLWSLLGDDQLHIVIRESSIRYLRPVRGEIRAVCKPPEAGALARFKAILEENGKSHVELAVEIIEDGQVCVEFRGNYVAIG